MYCPPMRSDVFLDEFSSVSWRIYRGEMENRESPSAALRICPTAALYASYMKFRYTDHARLKVFWTPR